MRLCAGLCALLLGLGAADAAGRAHRRRARPPAAPVAPAPPVVPTPAPADEAADEAADGKLDPVPLVDPLWPLAPTPPAGPAAPPAADPQPAAPAPADAPGPSAGPGDRAAPPQALPPLRQRVTRYDHYRLHAQLALPFTGAWTAYNASPGGRNTHYLNANQRYAVDWLISRPGGDGRRRTCAGRCRDNGDFYAYGREVLAPADGQVVQVVDGVPDNRPGQVDVYYRLGNTVVLSLGAGEYAYLSHLQPGSITVRPGETVRRGQRLARCGNSGNSSEPHLHLQIGDSPLITQAASMPLLFQRVLRNGEPTPEAVPQTGDEFAPAPGAR